MGKRLTELGFAEWVRHVFDHPVSDPAWHFDLEADYWDGPAALTVAHMTRLFRDPLAAMTGYTDAQLNQGLWYIVHNACSSCMLALSDEHVSLVSRLACVKAIFSLNQDLFATRCSPHLGHQSETGNPLNSICYMWWDLIPLLPDPDRHPALDETVLAVMHQTLLLDAPACQEGALHGLGHWAYKYADQIDQIIAGYLQQYATLRPELRAYAQAAQSGCVL